MIGAMLIKEISFDDEAFEREYTSALPTRRFAPFFDIDVKKYHAIKCKSLEINNIRMRLPREDFGNLMRSVVLTHYYAKVYFPAYKALVNEFVNEEWLALVDYHKKFHRDHIVHQPKVNWVGHELLKLEVASPYSGLPGKKRIIDHMIDVITGSAFSIPSECGYLRRYGIQIGLPEQYFDCKWVNKNNWRELWWYDVIKESFFLAALFHDIGYPINYLKKIDKDLNIQFPLEMYPAESVVSFCKKYEDRLLFYPLHDYQAIDTHSFPFDWEESFRRMLTRSFSETHSIQGAMTFLYLNDLIRKFPLSGSPRPDKQFIVDLAAMMILMHDMAGVYMELEQDDSVFPTVVRVKEIPFPQLRVKFHRDPFSFLLLMADLLQDFGRSNAEFEEPDKVASFKCSAKCTAVNLTVNHTRKNLHIDCLYSNEKEAINQRNRFLPANRLKFFDRHTGFIDYSYLFNEITIDAKKK